MDDLRHTPPSGAHTRPWLRHPWLRTGLEWLGILALAALLLFTDTGKDVNGWLKQQLLRTGFFQPDIPLAQMRPEPANFNVHLMTLDGEPVSLASFRGSAIFMNIWATWCPPCLAEMPYIQSLHDDLQGTGVAFVMISTDDADTDVQAFLDRKGYTFPVYRLAAPLPPPYTSNVLPTTYIIGADGTLGLVHAGMANYDKPEFRTYLRKLNDAGNRPSRPTNPDAEG